MMKQDFNISVAQGHVRALETIIETLMKTLDETMVQYNTVDDLEHMVETFFKADLVKRDSLKAFIAICRRDLCAAKNYVMRYNFNLAA